MKTCATGATQADARDHGGPLRQRLEKHRPLFAEAEYRLGSPSDLLVGRRYGADGVPSNAVTIGIYIGRTHWQTAVSETRNTAVNVSVSTDSPPERRQARPDQDGDT